MNVHKTIIKTDCTLTSENNDPYPNALVRDIIHTLKNMLDLIMSHRQLFWQGATRVDPKGWRRWTACFLPENHYGHGSPSTEHPV
jgi:hypothetical protein